MNQTKTLFLILFLVTTSRLFAEESEKDTIQALEKQIVTASRIPTLLKNTNRAITIIDHDEIINSSARTISELLEYVPGVDIRHRGINGIQADVHMRGGTFEQTLVLIDGIKMNDAQTAHHTMNLPIALADIERIEVLRGHGSRLYGPNASGGVINIITQKGHDKKISARMLAGEHGTADVLASFSYPIGPSGHRLTLNKSVSSGYRKGTEYDLSSASYNAQFRFKNVSQNFFIGYIDKPFGASGFYVANSNEWEHTKTFCMHSYGDIKIDNITLSQKIYWRKHNDAWIYDRFTSTDTSKHATNSYGAELQAAIPSKFGNSIIGMVAGEERIASTSLGDHSRYSFGFVGEHQLNIKDIVQIAPGIMVYYYSKWGWQAFPGVDLGIRIVDNLKFYSTIGRSFRIPSYTEYYMNHTGANIYGDKDLTPGNALSFETGISYSGKIVSSSVTGYYRHGNEIIDWLINDTTNAQNVTSRNINTSGLETGVTFFPKKIDEVIPVSRSLLQYTFIHSDFDKITGYTSKYLGNPLKHQFLASMTLSPFAWLDHTWHIKYEKRLTQEGYVLLDTRLNIHIWESIIFLEAVNILDTEYEDITSIPMPGRWFRGGLSISLGK